MLQRARQRVMFRSRRGQRRARRCKRAFGSVALLGGRGASLLGFDAPRLGFGERLRRCLRLDFRLLAARAACSLPSPSAASCSVEPPALLLGPRELRARRFERRFGDAPLGAHRRLAGEQFGKRGFGLTRSGFGRAQARSRSVPHRASASSSRRSIAAAPSSSCGDRLGGIALERFLAGNVAVERGIEPIELGQPPGNRIAPRARRRELMGELVALLARLRQRGAAFGERSVRARPAPPALRRSPSGSLRPALRPPALRHWPPPPRARPRSSAHGAAAPRPRGSGRSACGSARRRAPGGEAAPRAAPGRRGFRRAGRDWPRSRAASARRPCAAHGGRRFRPLPRAAAGARPAWRKSPRRSCPG